MNRLAVSLQQSIHTLHERRWSARRIARELGLHRDTVRRELKRAKLDEVGAGTGEVDSKPAKVATGSRSLCEAHRAKIEAALAQGLSAVRTHYDLVRRARFRGPL